MLIVDEPTRGIDVGAKYGNLYAALGVVAAGKSLIIVSSDLPELMGICHRIMFFQTGRLPVKSRAANLIKNAF